VTHDVLITGAKNRRCVGQSVAPMAMSHYRATSIVKIAAARTDRARHGTGNHGCQGIVVSPGFIDPEPFSDALYSPMHARRPKQPVPSSKIMASYGHQFRSADADRHPLARSSAVRGDSARPWTHSETG